jgi:parallel beta-helix repeat protein
MPTTCPGCEAGRPRYGFESKKYSMVSSRLPRLDRGTTEPRERKGPKPLSVVTATLVVVALFASSLLLVSYPSAEDSAPVQARISYDIHPTIRIDGDAQFNNSNYPNNGVVSGDGSAANPYVIQGWDIIASGAYGILIMHTSSHFIIRDCYFHGGGMLYSGIYVLSSFGVIENNTSTGNLYGVFIQGSNNRVLSNNCSGNQGRGILLWSNSNNNTLYNNNCSYNSQSGIEIYASSNNTLFNNTLTYNQYGVDLESSNNITVYNNTFDHNNYAGHTYDLMYVQALDSGGADNHWNTSSGYGNWWGDWTTPDNVEPFGIVDLPYDLSWTDGPRDYYPLTAPGVVHPAIPEFSGMIVPMAGILGIVLVVGARRRMRRA